MKQLPKYVRDSGGRVARVVGWLAGGRAYKVQYVDDFTHQDFTTGKITTERREVQRSWPVSLCTPVSPDSETSERVKP